MQQPLNESSTNCQQYRPGDWIEVKRQPKNNGAYLKRGDQVQVDFAHPTNGSVKFWNKQCSEWDYLWPEDIKPCPPPAESVVEKVTSAATETPAESVVEKVTSAATKTPAESVVEKVTSAAVEPPAESVVEKVTSAATKTPAESVVEKVTSAATKTPAESVVENTSTTSGWIDFHYKVRIDGRQHSIRRQQNKSTGPYYIYRWLEGKKQRAKYLPAQKMGEVYRA